MLEYSSPLMMSTSFKASKISALQINKLGTSLKVEENNVTSCRCIERPLYLHNTKVNQKFHSEFRKEKTIN